MQTSDKGVLSQCCTLFLLACFSIYIQIIVQTASCLLRIHFHFMPSIRIFPSKATTFRMIRVILRLTDCSKKVVSLRYSETYRRKLHKLQYHLMLFFHLIYRHHKLQSSKLVQAFQLEMLRALQNKHVFILKE